MSNNQVKTLVEEVFESMHGPKKDIGAHLCKYRILMWFKPLKHDPYYLMRLVSDFAKNMDWEAFEPGTTPVISIHAGSIYSFKEFAHQNTGIREVDGVVLGSSTEAGLEAVISIVQSMGLDNLVKMDLSEEVIWKAMLILPLKGLLSFDTWVEPEPFDPEYEPIDERHESEYGVEVRRPRDAVEGDLFSAALDESEALRLLLKIMSRKSERKARQPEGQLRCWDLLRYARELQAFGAVNEAGVVAGAALQELLLPLSHLSHEDMRRDRLMFGKVISLVERHKKLHPSETAILREFAELRSTCAHAITTQARPDDDLAPQVDAFINWLESYPDWLK